MADRPEDAPQDPPRSSEPREDAGDSESDSVRPRDTRGDIPTPGGDRPRTAPSTGRNEKPAPEPGASASPGSNRPTGWLGLAYDIGTSILAVLLIGGFLFAVSGVWPPLVAVESSSMVPNMHQGDLVFVMEEQRFDGDPSVAGTGVVTAKQGAAADYRTFGGYGDVIVFERDGRTAQTPIIHRAMLWVEKGENWSEKADPAYVGTTVCERDSDPATDTGLENCPAPHDGFITKGDNNGGYDQVIGLSGPVKPDWVVGTAELRLPGVGWIRLGSP